MSDRKRARLDRLRAMVAGQSDEELRTQFASTVDEIAKLEAEIGSEPKRKRKLTTGRDRKARGGHDRGNA